MTAAYDPELVARLAREAREDDASLRAVGPKCTCNGAAWCEDWCPAYPQAMAYKAASERCEANLLATADQLEAAQVLARRYDDDLQVMRATEGDLQYNRRRADEAERQIEAMQARIAELESERDRNLEMARVAADARDVARARIVELEKRLADEERDCGDLIDEREFRESQLNAIADVVGDEGEWSNLHDRGVAALELAGQIVAERDRLRDCMRKAGLECFMRDGTPDQVAEHMRSTAELWSGSEAEVVAAETERDAANARILQLEESARTASENWISACRERDEARKEVERLRRDNLDLSASADLVDRKDRELSALISQVDAMRSVVIAAERYRDHGPAGAGICDAVDVYRDTKLAAERSE